MQMLKNYRFIHAVLIWVWNVLEKMHGAIRGSNSKSKFTHLVRSTWAVGRPKNICHLSWSYFGSCSGEHFGSGLGCILNWSAAPSGTRMAPFWAYWPILGSRISELTFFLHCTLQFAGYFPHVVKKNTERTFVGRRWHLETPTDKNTTGAFSKHDVS